MMVHAQSNIGERTARLEAQSVDIQVRMARFEVEQEHVQTEVSTMNGIGIGLGAALGILQILQIIIGRQKAL
jgi:hypothetical protein